MEEQGNMIGKQTVLALLFLGMATFSLGQTSPGSNNREAGPARLLFTPATITADINSYPANIQNGGWKEYTIFYIDSIFNIINNGTTRIFVDLNGYYFVLTAYPQEVHPENNTFLLPIQDTLVIDIADYLIPDSYINPLNKIRLYPQGPSGSEVTIIIGDLVLGDKIDFVLRLNPLPEKLDLTQNYPNPFNASTTLQYTIPQHLLFGVNVKFEIYNLLGQKIRSLDSGKRFPGTYSFIWDGTNAQGIRVASGVYLYLLTIDSRHYIKQMILVK